MAVMNSEKLSEHSFEILKALGLAVKDREEWVFEGGDSKYLSDHMKEMLATIKNSSVDPKTARSIIAFIKVTAFMRFESSIKALAFINSRDPEFVTTVLNYAKKRGEKLYIEDDLNAESLVMVERFKLLLALELIGKVFDNERRERIAKVLEGTNYV
ncbi:MAG: hypothetical protein IBX55_00115 [Methyloprofundus sp.]|nr:hypothetical protein [Methyloprofundus sp.]